jgi:hypothetical protein
VSSANILHDAYQADLKRRPAATLRPADIPALVAALQEQLKINYDERPRTRRWLGLPDRPLLNLMGTEPIEP